MPRTIEELSEHACVLFRGRNGRTEWELSDEAGNVHTVRPKGAISADELLFVRRAIEVSAGIGLLPLTSIAQCTKQGFVNTLIRVLPEYASRGGLIHVVSPSLEYAPRRVTVLRDYLVQELAILHRPG